MAFSSDDLEEMVDSNLSFTDDVSDMEDEKKASPDEEKEDDFIQGIKAAREKPWNSLPFWCKRALTLYKISSG